MKVFDVFYLTLFIVISKYICVNTNINMSQYALSSTPTNSTSSPPAGCLWIYESCDQTGPYKQFCSFKGKTKFKSDEYVGSIKLGVNTTWGLKRNDVVSRPERSPNQQPPCFTLRKFKLYEIIEVNYEIPS